MAAAYSAALTRDRPLTAWHGTGLSILVHGPIPSDKLVSSVLPYLIGSLGTMAFDFVILGQFFIYSARSKPAEADSDPNESAHVGVEYKSFA